MNNPEDKVLLFKLGKAQDIESFRSGIVHMNTLSYFQGVEDCELRGDKNENISACIQAQDAEFFRKNTDGERVLLGTINDQILTRLAGFNPNVFCMYSFMVSPQKQIIDPKILKFGDKFVLFLEPTTFINRINEESKKLGFNLEYQHVEYVHRKTFNGEMGVFRKFETFAYQSEFRIMANANPKGAWQLNIGDISDITEIGELTIKDLNSAVRKYS